ncbi:hypothetical protein HNP84_000598 [Thermocatellispora tengchongensis]|uniref:Uncharacterized protein n=1 Tax=Thermocatellispora tengchongensis TaxID=1073253 RepID=A0A840P0D9_9ACTN|nr:hypothetical protein [Thermocatellispora tengchongensis]MBB5130910.1 hypothetical protein [Thermocatellispora tengchongensis]
MTELEKDVWRLETDDVFKNPLKKLRIIQRPDKDIACDKGKFKRAMRATADYKRVSDSLIDHLDLAEDLKLATLRRHLGYKLEFDFSQSDAEEGRFVYGTKEHVGVKMTVYVAPEAPTWRLHGQTACLPRKGSVPKEERFFPDKPGDE